jgi:hypothetical protein
MRYTVLIWGLLTLFVACKKEIPQKQLTVNITPNVGGSVTPSSGLYAMGTIVQLLATPSSEYVFKEWSGGYTGITNPANIVMDADKIVNAVFEKRQYPLNLTIVGSGAVAEEIIKIASASNNYISGTTVRLTPQPATGYQFKKWSGDDTSSKSPLDIVVIKPYNLTCTFEKIPIVIDYSTKYTTNQNIQFSKALILQGLNPETLKIINISGKYHLVSSYANNQSVPFDYFRSFSIDTTSGGLIENTNSLLGGYYEAGFPKSPFWYEDLNNDGIKDLFISDHGKEIQSQIVNNRYPGFVCRYFIGKNDGTFTKSDITDVTTVNRFYHNSAVGDLNGDGKNDLVVQNFDDQEMMLYLNSTSGLSKFGDLTIGNQTGSVLIADIDGDKQAEIISAPYIDRGNTPNTFVKKINLSGNSYSTSKLSSVTPFGSGYGCYKVIGMKNPKDLSKMNLFFLVEGGPGQQKIFRSRTDNSNILDEISTIQNTFNTGGTRDYLIADLNFDGLDDIFFYVNSGQDLNSRVWLNNGDNTFTNSIWDIDNTLKNNFIPVLFNPTSGRIKFLYLDDSNTPFTKIIDVYTKKK